MEFFARNNITILGLVVTLLCTPLAAQAVSWPMLQGSEEKAFKKGKKAPFMKVWGFVQPLYMFQNEGPYAPLRKKGGDNSFLIRRTRVGIRGSITDRVNYFFLSEFGDNGITRKTGAVSLTDASISIKLADGLRIRMGQFKVPFGIDGLQAIHRHIFINFSQAASQMLLRPDRNFAKYTGEKGAQLVHAYRDIGIQAFDQIKVGPGAITYAVGLFNGSGINRTDNNKKKDVIGKLQYDWMSGALKGLEIGASYANGKHTADELEYTRWGVELQFDRGPVHLMAEYMAGKDEQKDGAADIEDKGWYVAAGYDIVPKRLRADVRYDVFEPDKKNADYNRTTLGLMYFFKGWNRFTLNYEIIDDEANPDRDSAVGAQFTIIF